MKTRCAVLLLSLVALSASAAPPTDASLRTLFAVMKAESIAESAYTAMEPAIRQGMAQAAGGREPTAEQQRILDRFPQKMAELMRTELSWAKMEPMQLKVYRESFEQAEIDGLIAFYRSPVGQSFVTKMPVVTQKTMMEMQIYMQQVMPRIQAAMQELIAEVKSAN